VFSTPLYFKLNSNISDFHNFNENKTTNNLDSKFNNNFIEEEDSILGTSAQGRAIGHDLLNILDSDSSYDAPPTQSSSLNGSSGTESPPYSGSIKAEAINAPSFKPTFLKTGVVTQQLFDFPEGGWECSKCQNYNFKGRDICYRCKKEKGDEDSEGKPKHMSQAKLTKKQKRALKAEQDGSG
jgi:hypothetical protein